MTQYPPPQRSPGPDPDRRRPAGPKPSQWSAREFTARAIGGFLLFFGTLIVANRVGTALHSGYAALFIIVAVFIGLVITSFVFHRRGWLTGWLLGFMLPLVVLGLLLFTCRMVWNK